MFGESLFVFRWSCGQGGRECDGKLYYYYFIFNNKDGHWIVIIKVINGSRLIIERKISRKI